MVASLKHRGPDDAGSYYQDASWSIKHSGGGRGSGSFDPHSKPGVALGFRRLSIIDLAGGRQPLPNEDETIWVIFNGEIYNFADLRRRLEASGHRFRTQSDTETIVHLYEDEGIDCFSKLNGMFAIAIWDGPRRRLVLARDRLGQKPLLYARQDGRLAFASEMKSLFKIPKLPREIDPNAIDEFLSYQYVPHPNTIYKGISKLPPGHVAVYEDNQLEVKPYWKINFAAEYPTTWKEATQQVQELLTDSVRLRMRSDVPLGAFLSGGVDSSLIVALMQEQSSQPIKTFSIGFPIDSYNETQFAQQVAKSLGTDHHEFQVTPDSVKILPSLVQQYDEPFADSSAIPTWYVSQMTREHVTVALSGDGGDELFAGYPRYRAVRLSSYIDRLGPLRSLISMKLWQKLPGQAKQKGLLRRAKRFASAMSMSPFRRYVDWIGIFNEERRAALYNDSFVQRLGDHDPFVFFDRAVSLSKGRDPVSRVSMADLITYLPCDLMTKVDMASMAHSLEVRQPFLDYRLVEYAASLPVRFKMKRLSGKLMLRKAFGDRLPDAIWNRPKMGFGVPLDHWFRKELNPMARDVLLDPKALCLEYFRGQEIAKLLREHESHTFDHAYRLWSLLILELWLRQWHSQ